MILQNKGSWKVVFLLAASVHFIGVTFYALFASGELQPWAEENKKQPWEEGNKTPPVSIYLLHKFKFLFY